MIFKHPIVQAGIVLLIFRMVGVVFRYVFQSGDWNATSLEIFVTATLYNFATLLLIVALLLFIWKLLPKLQSLIGIFVCLFFPVLMLFGQIDLSLSSITGAQLTPTVFRTYRGPHLLISKEFIDPVKANWLPISILVSMSIFAAMRIVKAFLSRKTHLLEPSYGLILTIFVTAIVFTQTPQWLGLYKSPPPVEFAFIEGYSGLDKARLSVSETKATEDFRKFLGLPEGASWVGDDFPLAYSFDSNAEEIPDKSKISPDIIVVMVESLRGANVGFLHKDRPESPTPHLDAMAEKSIVFPFYISNGFPSSPGVVAFNCSAWPHYKKEIMTDFSDQDFDCLPDRLGSFGYQTFYIGGNPGFDNQDLFFRRWYQNIFAVKELGAEVSDKNIINKAIEVINKQDLESPDKPLFAYISTSSSHYPFQPPPDDVSPLPDKPLSDYEKYLKILLYTDKHIGNLFSFLDKRRKKDNTILIIQGDHGFYVDFSKTTGLPVNDVVWTSAIIQGPEKLLGKPRWDYRAASAVDMLPTILKLIGDRRPSASLGNDLLGLPRNKVPMAVAVRTGGIRMDKAGKSLIIDTRNPGQAKIYPAFPENLLPNDLQKNIFVDEDKKDFQDFILYWSYLIENNKVWNKSILNEVK